MVKRLKETEMIVQDIVYENVDESGIIDNDPDKGSVMATGCFRHGKNEKGKYFVSFFNPLLNSTVSGTYITFKNKQEYKLFTINET